MWTALGAGIACILAGTCRRGAGKPDEVFTSAHHRTQRCRRDFRGVPDDWQRGTSIGSIAHGTSAVVLFRAQSGQTFTLQTNNGFGLITPPETFLVRTSTWSISPG